MGDSMKIRIFAILNLLFFCMILPACSFNQDNTSKSKQEIAQPGTKDFTQLIIERYKNKIPHQWGEKVTGVKTRLDTKEKVIALTFDACGGPKGSGYDSNLIEYLIKENVPATLFINGRWIDANLKVFLGLSRNPLFDIENHGFLHRPLSINGKSAYGIKGTRNIREVIDEVSSNSKKIYSLTGKKTKFFRAGTAYCDEVAVQIVKDLGEDVVSFSVLGDAGATYTKEQIKKAFLTASPGSIIICHMNHPEKETAAGLKLAIPVLKKQGFRFVKLKSYPLK
jgi:peptidoglycan/xylan/chitin deacetylase (PgdA/CDA1 family)